MIMTEHKFSPSFFGVLLLTASAVLLSGCGKKETPQESSPPVAAMPQPPAVPAGQAADTAVAGVEAAMKKSDCFACHAVDKKLIGPAYSWVAFRYKDDKEAVSRLVEKVKKGGLGQWDAYTGKDVMTPHAQLPDDEIKAMVEWVLSRPPVEPPKV